MIIMKKYFLLIPLVMLILLCCSCNNNSTDTKKIDYSIFTENKNTNSNIVTPTDIPPVTNTTASSGEFNKSTETKEWPSDIEFSGVKSKMNDFKLGNLGGNYKINSQFTCLICSGTLDDSIYYINEGNDKYIYQLKNDKSTLLVDMEANNLQLWENKLYFINVQNNNPYYDSGYLYSYDIATKELTLISDRNIASFFIDNYGIYYSELTSDYEFNVSRLDFNNTITPLKDYPWLLSYNEFLLTNWDGYLSLINRETDEIIQIMPFKDDINLLSSLHIIGDNLIFVIDSRVYILNLVTGAKKIYDVNDCAGLVFKVDRIVDLVCIKDVIYVAYGSNLIIKIDMASDDIKQYFTSEMDNFYYSFLNTNGDQLFALRFDVDMVTGNSNMNGVEELIIPPEPGNEITIKELGK